MTGLIMIFTVIGMLVSPVLIPSIIYDATGDQEIATCIQAVTVILDVLGVIAWTVFFA